MSKEHSKGQGVVRIEILPLPASTSMAGYLQACKLTDAKLTPWIWTKEANNFNQRWVVLTGEHLIMYATSPTNDDLKNCTPSDTIFVGDISAIRDHAGHFEVVNGEVGTVWQFKRDVRTGSMIRQHKERKLWLQKLSLASGIDVQVDDEAQHERVRSTAKASTFGRTLLDAQRSNMEHFNG